MVQRVTGREKLDIQKAVSWLDQHWLSSKICPICQKNSWVISDELLEMRPYRGGSLVAGGSIYPLFAVTCEVCGHTLLFSAVTAGLVKSRE